MKNIHNSQFSNHIHTLGFLGAMAGLLGLLGWFLAGIGGVKLALMVSLIYFFFSPALPTRMIMRAYRAKPLHPRAAPILFNITRTLSMRAGLEVQPALYLLPGKGLNAFATGTRQDPAVCLSYGLIRALDTDELAGIIGHEITHIKQNDMRVMALAGTFGRMTGMVSLVGQILMVMYLPVLISGQSPFPFFPLLVMVFAPAVSLLMHLALSRTREYSADLGSARLTGNPRALASALGKIEMIHKRAWHRMFIPGRVAAPNTLMSTHPPTKERIRRLLSLTGQHALSRAGRPARFGHPLGWTS